MAWKGESRRHSLARKGIKTRIDKNKRLDVSKFVAGGRKYSEDAFETGEKLEAFLDTPLGEEFIGEHFESLYEIPFNDHSEEEGIPYWIDSYEDMVTEEWILEKEFDGELMEHQMGYYDPYRIGQNKTINGKEYYYVGSIGSSEELELQADNGELVYYSLGSNFFRIWKRFPETYISWEEDDSYELIHKDKTIEKIENVIGLSPQDIRDDARRKGFDVPKIIWDDSENKFVKMWKQ